MKRFYLGLNAGGPKVFKCLFGRGGKDDIRQLSEILAEKYHGTPILMKNGRSGLALALKSYFDYGDKIIVNAFTCHAVIEAITEAGMTPVYADITKENLNFDVDSIAKVMNSKVKGIIVQNSLGNPVDIEKIEKFATDKGLLIVEDLAHSAGIKYPDGRVAGTVGVATVLSFGKDKAINAISGGAVVLRYSAKHRMETPFRSPKISDVLRARFYPLFCACSRGLNHIHLGGILMKALIKIHWVERSADNKLSLNRKMPKYQARLAVEQIKKFRHRGQAKLREFYLVEERAKVLDKLRGAGYYFDAFWYEKPVSPERYYKEVFFPENKCPVAMEVTSKIINFPNYYSRKELEKAYEIIKPYLVENYKGGIND